MQVNSPQPSSGPGGDGVRLLFKVTAVLALLLVGFSAVKIVGKKYPAPGAAIAGQEPSSEPAPEPEPPMPPPRTAPSERANARPANIRTTVDSGLGDEAIASNLWAAAGAPSGSKKVIWRRLPELQTGVDGVIARFEPPVFYDVAEGHVSELRSDFAQIANATNMLKQYAADFQAVKAGLQADRQEYVRYAKAADERRQNEYDAAKKRQIDLQALYLERKRQFQQESAATKPRLQDPPGVFESKLAQYERVKKSYEDDMNQLEVAIHVVTKQVAATGQELRGLSQNIDSAFEESAQDAIGRLSGLSNRLYQQLGGVNTLIRDYNLKLGRYGTPLEPAR